MPSWTKDQALAINTRGGKIIVSAAAGSGKTAVLSERVINFVLSGGNIDELLIVTFTKAAAMEMKGRIKEKIIEAKEKSSDEHLERQLKLVDSALITTMDAFYADIVKDNFEKLGINKNFSILSNEEENILKEEVVKKTLEDAFLNVSGYFEMLKAFGANTVNLVKDVVFKLSSFLDTIPNSKIFMDKVIENYDRESNFYKELLLKQIRDKMKALSEVYSEVIEELYNESTAFDKILDLVRKEKNYINDFLTIKEIDDLASRIRTIEFDTLRTPTGHKDDPVMVKFKVIREEFKNLIRKSYSELKFISDESFEKEKSFCKKNLEVLFLVTNNYKDMLLNEKMKKNAFSFGDIAHFCIKLLTKDGKKTSLAKEIQKRFKEILIDEYQDTNNLQNVIFNAISDDNKNLFIVGDVKQSIYRFRSACPSIFNNDKNEASKESFPKLITLSKNFRSRSEVLDFCNFIFSNTMTNYFGEVNYDKDEMLYQGASFEEGKNLNTELHIIDGMEKSEEEDDLPKVQKEAIYVSDRIKKLIDDKEKVYDNKRKIWRCIKPSDIVILLRSLKNSNFYVEALNKRGISVYSESSLEYFDNYEVKLIINLLKIIDNLYDDVALLSVLNSSLICANLDLIATLRSKNKSISLYENIKDTTDGNITYLLENLKMLKDYALNHSIHELLNKAYKTFNVIPIISGQTCGRIRKKNLVMLLNHASSFEENKTGSLHEFISYIENIILNKGTLTGINPLSDGDNVLITTIHKSKGLEYPYVFLSETGKNFNFSDVRSDLMINADLGIAFNIRDDKYKAKYESSEMMLFKEYEKEKMLSEELRVLYVALTRAKEKIIITGYVSNLEKQVTNISSKIGDNKVISSLYLNSVKNYLDIILACALRHPSCKSLRDLSMVDCKTFADSSRIDVHTKSAIEINNAEFNEKIKKDKKDFDIAWYKKISEFNYDNELSNTPKYLSVSTLKENKGILRKPKFMTDGISHTNLGTLYHRIFELLPVKKYGVSSLKEELDNLCKENKITKEELKLINLDNIFAYLTSDIYDILLSCDELYREKSLLFEVPSSYYDKNLKSGKMLTEGIIDLLFVKDGCFYIVDYKTDNVTNLEELKTRYKLQLDLYEIAVKSKMNAKNVKKFIYSIKLNKFIEV